jgi:alpha-amylase
MFLRALSCVLGLCGLLAVSGVQAGDQALPWWRKAVFYEIFVRSFADSTEGPLANDGIGDLRGLIGKLDYLNDGNPETKTDLGVTALWLMPIMQSPSYHGYDVSNYYRVNPEYGTHEDFKELISEAHKRGIKIIVDMVLNHASSSHSYFESAQSTVSRYRDWFVWSKKPKDRTGAYGNEAWHQTNHEYYYGFFSSSMPDWNLRNPRVTEELHEVARFWIETMNVDGFRLDAVRYLVEDDTGYIDSEGTHAWLGKFHAYTKKLDAEAFTVGEVWAETATTASYGPDELDTSFQFELASELIKTVNNGVNMRLDNLMDELGRRFPGYQYATFLSNHDQPRVMTVLGDDPARAKLAATLLMTLPGVPFMYYGEEIGMQGRKPDPDLRTPMHWSAHDNAGFSENSPWAPLRADYPVVNVAAQQASNDSLWNYYQRLIRMRSSQAALHQGDFTFVPASSKKIFAFERCTALQCALIVVNLGGKTYHDYWLEKGIGKNAKEIWQGETELQKHAVAPKQFRPIKVLQPRAAYLITYSR